MAAEIAAQVNTTVLVVIFFFRERLESTCLFFREKILSASEVFLLIHPTERIVVAIMKTLRL